jgi:hypothetical protein
MWVVRDMIWMGLFHERRAFIVRRHWVDWMRSQHQSFDELHDLFDFDVFRFSECL